MNRRFVNVLVLTALLVALLGPARQVDAVTGPLSSAEQDILHASDMQSGDELGRSVAMSGDVLVVGARYEDGGPGDPESNAGAAYVFTRDPGGNTWSQVKILHASDPQVNDEFGLTVAISGDTIVVGAALEDGGPGSPLFASGAVYIFERNQGGPDNWGQVKILHASDAQANDHFGRSVAIDGDTLVVGAYSESGGSGDPLPEAGAAYVLERNQGGANNWGEVAILRASDAQAYDWFSEPASIGGDTIVLGARYEDGGVGDPLTDVGAVYIFERNQGGPGNWGEVKILRASDRQALDHFGRSVALDGDTVIVGAWYEDGGPGDPASDAGAAYIFERNQGGANNWGEMIILHASDAQAGDHYGGYGVAVSGDIVVVGAYLEDGGPGNPLPDSGAAYIYARDLGGPDQWSEFDKITASDAEAGDNFGIGVWIEGATVIVGARYEDGGLGDPQLNAGAAYAYTVNVPPNVVGDAFEVMEDSQENPLAVLENDSDYEADPLVIVDVSAPDQGGTVVFANTMITYTPAADFFGVETFVYTITDGMDNQGSALVTVTVAPVNNAPIAAGDSYTTTEDMLLAVTAPGLMANDDDVDGDLLTTTLIASPTHGLLALSLDGSFTYTPTLNYAGLDYFTYQLADATLTDTAVVTLTILPVNDAPIAASDNYTVTEDVPLLVAAPGLLANDSDVDGDLLTATLDSNPAHGLLALNLDGSFAYTPTLNYAGLDYFTYQLADATLTGTATVTLTILPVNDAPVAAGDSYTTTEDVPLVVAAPGLLVNDSDVESDPLTATLASDPIHGTLTLSADGSFVYTPEAGYSGSDSFTYYASDGGDNSSIVSVTITVLPAAYRIYIPVTMNQY